jgi:Amiloride-sensitive sodium channel
MMAAASTDTNLVVSRSFLSKLESPYGNCLNDISVNSKFISYYFDYIVRTADIAYTQKYCFNLCLHKQIMNTCGCADPYLPKFKTLNITICLVFEDGPCVFGVVSNFGDSQANTNCQAACPFECSSILYEVSTFKSLYPTQFYQGILSKYSLIKYNNISYDDIPSAVAKANVYYNDLTYKETTEAAAITTETFFSNMGGTLGLYIGISLLSLVEMIELVINYIVAVLSHSKAVSQFKSSGQKIFPIDSK